MLKHKKTTMNTSNQIAIDEADENLESGID